MTPFQISADTAATADHTRTGNRQFICKYQANYLQDTKINLK